MLCLIFQNQFYGEFLARRESPKVFGIEECHEDVRGPCRPIKMAEFGINGLNSSCAEIVDNSVDNSVIIHRCKGGLVYIEV